MEVRAEDVFEALLPRTVGANAMNRNDGALAAIRPAFRRGHFVSKDSGFWETPVWRGLKTGAKRSQAEKAKTRDGKRGSPGV